MDEDRLTQLVKSNPMPTWWPIALTLVVLLGAGLAWSLFAEIDEVTVAEGKIVPKGDLKVVQHLEGGVIKEIYVHEGSRVALGQPLMQLDVNLSTSEREETQVQLLSQLALQARLVAEATGNPPVFPEDVRQKFPSIVATQQNTFDSRKTELASSINVLENQLQQKQQEVKDLRNKLDSVSRNLQLAQVRLDDGTELLKDQLIARDEYRKLQAEVENLRSEVNSTRQNIVRAEASVAEVRGRIQEKVDGFRREARTELGKVLERIARLREELTVSTERSSRLEIRSPTDGIVKNLRYTTIGGVVKAGEPIMEIVPVGDKLVVSAKLNPSDRGFVSVGQRAKVKVSTYDFVRYGGLEGTVSLVAADATKDEESQKKDKTYFEVIVETEKNYLGEREGELPITPGMQATVDIHTGKKKVIDYLINPLIKAASEAFRER